ncbi:Zinc finger, A20-type [Sesbania bispinosa]|nr:Zinc finger, A20-type [Sesbania bispinosa]
MAEEHRCEAPEGHRLCANNCGFLGSPATMNLCSKCYGDIRLKEQEEASTKSTIETALSSASSSVASAAAAIASPPPSTSSPSTAAVESVKSLPPPAALTEVASSSVAAPPVQPNRYPERHACSFDFKTVGREEIARANPMIRAEKLQRI